MSKDKDRFEYYYHIKNRNGDIIASFRWCLEREACFKALLDRIPQTKYTLFDDFADWLDVMIFETMPFTKNEMRYWSKLRDKQCKANGVKNFDTLVKEGTVKLND